MKKRILIASPYLILFCVFSLMVNTTLGYILTRQSGDAMKMLIQSRMLDISNTAAAMLDGDILENLRAEDEDTPEYQEILKTLAYYQDNIDLKYIYCIRHLGNRKFVFSVDPTVEDPGEFGEPIVYTDALYQASQGKAAVDDEPYEDRWGRFYSAYSPVFDSDHNVAGIVAVDFSAEWYDRQISKAVRTTLFIDIMALVFGVIIVVLIAARFRMRFRRLYTELIDLSDGIETLANELTDDLILEDRADLLHTEVRDQVRAGDDIDVMSNKIRSLQQYMGEQIDYVRSQTYKDMLTGLENRTSYLEYVGRMDEIIRVGRAEFAVAMFDINGLKTINDTQGHDKGDQVICYAAGLLKRAFPSERIFRVGGDEFVVIIRANELQMQGLFTAFEQSYGGDDPEGCSETVSMSKGFAVYDNSIDNKYQDVFIRADNAMYADKKAFYEKHGDRRRM